MSNETLDSCKNQSLSGGAVPQDQGRLFCERQSRYRVASSSLPVTRSCSFVIASRELRAILLPADGMVAPFANYSVAGWTWYQGENNVYGDMVRIHSPHERTKSWESEVSDERHCPASRATPRMGLGTAAPSRR